MPRPRKKKKIVTNASFDYKEQVAFQLARHYDVPLRIAEIAVIDLRYEVNVGFHNKWSTDLTAITMLEKVKRIYMTDGKWHYGYESPRSIVRNAVVSKTSNVGSIPTEGASSDPVDFNTNVQ